MSPKSNYDKHPCIPVSTSAADCWVGWRNIIDRLKPLSAESRRTLAVECYPGTFEGIIKDSLVEGLRPAGVIYTPDLLQTPHCVDKLLAPLLGDDPVFGRMNEIGLQTFFDESKLSQAREKVITWKNGLLLVIGVGAAIVSPQSDVLVYAELARWEIQGRQRRNEISNLGADNIEESPSLKYKRAFCCRLARRRSPQEGAPAESQLLLRHKQFHAKTRGRRLCTSGPQDGREPAVPRGALL